MSLGLSKFYAALVASAVLCAGQMVSLPAQAFTIENGDGGATSSNLMAPSPFNTPSKQDADKNGTRTQFGNTTIIMGPSTSPQQDYQTGINRMFSPLGRPPN